MIHYIDGGINEERFSNVAKQAEQLLCIPGTSVPSEHVFPSPGKFVNTLRCFLSSDNANTITILSKNESLPSTCSHLLPMPGLPKVETVEPEQPREGTYIIDVATILDEEVPALPDFEQTFPIYKTVKTWLAKQLMAFFFCPNLLCFCCF